MYEKTLTYSLEVEREHSIRDQSGLPKSSGSRDYPSRLFQSRHYKSENREIPHGYLIAGEDDSVEDEK